MISRVAWVALATTLMLGAGGPAADGATVATGSVSCTWTGQASIRPPVVFGGTAKYLKVRFRGKLSSCTGSQGGGVTIVGGTLRASGVASSNDCLSLIGGMPPMTGTVRWRVAPGTPRVVPSALLFTGGGFGLGSAVTIYLPGGETSFVTGSFVGDATTATIVTDQLTSAFADGCGSRRGVSGLTFTGTNGPSSITLSCGCAVSTTTTSSTTTSTLTPTTTTSLPPPSPSLIFTTTVGTTSCGSAGLTMQPAAPTSGQIDSDTACSTMISPLGLGCLYRGGGAANVVPSPKIPDGVASYLNLSGPSTLTGSAGTTIQTCTVGSGPGRHCINNDSLPACSTDTDCGGAVGSCAFDANCYFGAPLPIVSPAPFGPLTICVLDTVQPGAGGTFDAGTGDVSLSLPLSSRVYVTGNTASPCPKCISGTCDPTWKTNAGNPSPDQGAVCMSTGSQLTTLDCRPPLGRFQATLPVDLGALTTGTATLTASDGNFCPNQLNAGAFGQGAIRCIAAGGAPAGNLGDGSPHAVALGAVFCMPATGTPALDAVTDLPGPAALSLNGIVQLNTSGTFASTTTTSSTSTTASTTTTSTSTTTLPACTFLLTWGILGGAPGQFDGPAGVAVGASGNVYVTDFYNNRIQKFDANGGFLTTWGTSGSGPAQFTNPYGVGTDASENVYVTDTGNNRVQKFDANGTFLAMWGSYGAAVGQFNVPAGVAVDGSGNVFVADFLNHRIEKFDTSGTFVTAWGTPGVGNGQFQDPGGVATDGSGKVYVADTHNDRVQKFDGTGTFITSWGGVSSPYGVGTDTNGHVYVSDYTYGRVDKFDTNGVLLGAWGNYGSGSGQFIHPRGVATDAGGDVYVADHDNNRIQKFACP